MAVKTSYNATVSVNAVTLTSFTNKVTINDGQETRELRVMGNTIPVVRPGLATPSIEFTFYKDQAAGSVEATLRGLISITSTGVPIVVRYDSGAESTSNPQYEMDGVLDGDLMVMDDEAGEIPQISVRFLPYSYFNIYTSST